MNQLEPTVVMAWLRCQDCQKLQCCPTKVRPAVQCCQLMAWLQVAFGESLGVTVRTAAEAVWRTFSAHGPFIDKLHGTDEMSSLASRW